MQSPIIDNPLLTLYKSPYTHTSRLVCSSQADVAVIPTFDLCLSPPHSHNKDIRPKTVFSSEDHNLSSGFRSGRTVHTTTNAGTSSNPDPIQYLSVLNLHKSAITGFTPLNDSNMFDDYFSKPISSSNFSSCSSSCSRCCSYSCSCSKIRMQTVSGCASSWGSGHKFLTTAFFGPKKIWTVLRKEVNVEVDMDVVHTGRASSGRGRAKAATDSAHCPKTANSVDFQLNFLKPNPCSNSVGLSIDATGLLIAQTHIVQGDFTCNSRAVQANNRSLKNCTKMSMSLNPILRVNWALDHKLACDTLWSLCTFMAHRTAPLCALPLAVLYSVEKTTKLSFDALAQKINRLRKCETDQDSVSSQNDKDKDSHSGNGSDTESENDSVMSEVGMIEGGTLLADSNGTLGDAVCSAQEKENTEISFILDATIRISTEIASSLQGTVTTPHPPPALAKKKRKRKRKISASVLRKKSLLEEKFRFETYLSEPPLHIRISTVL